MADSGIFSTHREIGYEELFSRYQDMDVDYAIMKDYFMDATRTVESAREAVATFEKSDYGFQLVLVAQGNTVDEYIEWYSDLRTLGSFPIAVGGMLRRKLNSARYIHVSQEKLLDTVLRKIRQCFDPPWLFALGVYHPKRHDLLVGHHLFGSDYKGWIFNYVHRRDLILQEAKRVASNGVTDEFPTLVALLEERVSLGEKVTATRLALRGNLEGAELETAKCAHSSVLAVIDRLDKRIFLELRTLTGTAAWCEIVQGVLSPLFGLLSASEQEVRFQGVHSYFASELLPRVLVGEDSGS